MLLCLRALLGRMPGRTAYETSATTVTATSPNVVAEATIFIEASESWWNVGPIVAVVVPLSVVLQLFASALIVVESTTSTSIAYVRSVTPTTQLPHCCLCSRREFLHSLNNVVNSLLY